MLVRDLKLEDTDGGVTLSAEIVHERDRRTHRIGYRYRGLAPDQVAARGDAFVTTLVVPAMVAGEDLIVEAPVSPMLLGGVARAMELINSWDPLRYRIVDVVADPEPNIEQPGAGVGLFFSAGVDSFYSLLKNLEEHPEGPDAITHLVYVIGIGARKDFGPDTVAKIVAHVTRIAAEVGKELLVIDTNLRGNLWAPWRIHHGSATISTVLPIPSVLSRCLIASSNVPPFATPLGTHPQLDHLWSVEGISIVHDGADVYRTDKMRSHLARSELALRTMRVCAVEDQQPKNCGRCRKCLQAMISLHTAGALERCTTFVEPLRVHRVWTMHIEGRRPGARKHLDSLVRSRSELGLAWGMRAAILRHDVKQILKKLVRRRMLHPSRRLSR